MSDINIPVTTNVFNALIMACIKYTDFQNAFKIYYELAIYNLQPDDLTMDLMRMCLDSTYDKNQM